MKKLVAVSIEDKILQIDREGATAQTNIVALREKRRAAVRSGADDDADQIEKELLDLDRQAAMRAERREILVEEAADAARRAQVTEFERRAAAALRVNEVLAVRLRTEGHDLSEKLLALMNDVALAEIETVEVNRIVPDGMYGISSPNYMARTVPGVPRVDLEENEIDLWVFKSTGNLIGDQDRVVSSSNNDGSGYLPTAPMSSLGNIPVVRRKFKSKTYHPAIPAQYPEPMIEGVRLPNFDRPGVAFDGGFPMTYKRIGLPDAALPNAKPARREIQTELTPLAMPTDPPSIFQKVYAGLGLGMGQ